MTSPQKKPGPANLLDRIVFAAAPQLGLRRFAARSAGRAYLSTAAYEGNRTRRADSGWTASGSSATAIVGPNLDGLRKRCRDLERNNGYAARALTLFQDYVVGDGIRLRLTGPDQIVTRVMDAWRRWAEDSADSDRDGLRNFHSQTGIAVRTMARDGEVLAYAHFPMGQQARGLTVPLQIQILESDHLDHMTNRNATAGQNRIVYGVELGPDGSREAYYLYPNHPGDSYNGLTPPVRQPAWQVVHLFEAMRPGQHRAVSWLAPAIVRLRDHDDLAEATLIRAKIEAALGIFVTSPDSRMPRDLGTTTSATGEANSYPELSPGELRRLKPGEQVHVLEPVSTSSVAIMHELTLEDIANALNIPPALLRQNGKAGNYSSLRWVTLPWRLHVQRIGRQVVVPTWCNQIFRQFLAAGTMVGKWTVREVEALGINWHLPRFAYVDPQKDLAADQAEIRAGLATLADKLLERGVDPDSHLASIAAINARLDALGIVLDSDPRVTSAQGQAQAAETAPERESAE